MNTPPKAGSSVERTDQEGWGSGKVLTVDDSHARVSWAGGEVVSWVPFGDLVPA